MKNKKQLIGGALVLGMLVSVSSAFAADMNVATGTSPVSKTGSVVTHKKHHAKATSTEIVKTVEVKDDVKASGTEMMKKKEMKAKHHKNHKMAATTTPVMTH